MANSNRPLAAITSGDPNGVGYEVILKSLHEQHLLELLTPVIYGNIHVARTTLKTLDESMHNMPINVIDNVSKAQEGKINLINCYQDDLPLKFGRSTKEAGTASLMALSRAVQDIKNKQIDVLITAPINKENIQSEKFHFSGHTEYLTQHFKSAMHDDSLMMMVSEQMRVALVCNHVPLSKVPEHITEERILSKLRVLNQTLKDDFIIGSPHIAVLALNPHAGDNGLIGTEERDIIRPAIKRAYAEGIMAFGPYSADGFFGSGKYRHFEAILGMYHDQGLIPFKSLDMDGVNFTAGLDIIRTSPDHGTAYELAGKNEADPASMRNAMYLAVDLWKVRQQQQTTE